MKEFRTSAEVDALRIRVTDLDQLNRHIHPCIPHSASQELTHIPSLRRISADNEDLRRRVQELLERVDDLIKVIKCINVLSVIVLKKEAADLCLKLN